MVSSGPRSFCCHECRRRKVKCDGVKPACQRCAKRGIVCTGYPSTFKFLDNKTPAENQILLATKSNNAGVTSSSQEESRPRRNIRFKQGHEPHKYSRQGGSSCPSCRDPRPVPRSPSTTTGGSNTTLNNIHRRRDNLPIRHETPPKYPSRPEAVAALQYPENLKSFTNTHDPLQSPQISMQNSTKGKRKLNNQIQTPINPTTPILTSIENCSPTPWSSPYYTDDPEASAIPTPTETPSFSPMEYQHDIYPSPTFMTMMDEELEAYYDMLQPGYGYTGPAPSQVNSPSLSEWGVPGSDEIAVGMNGNAGTKTSDEGSNSMNLDWNLMHGCGFGSSSCSGTAGGTLGSSRFEGGRDVDVGNELSQRELYLSSFFI